MKKILSILLALTSLAAGSASAQLVHPGITHTQADLDRMRYMVESGIEPWKTSFENLSRNSRAQHTYTLGVLDQDPSFLTTYSEQSWRWFINDGTAAYYNALMWYITGDSRHAEKAIEIFNTYKGLRRNTTGIPLWSGRVWRIIEAAEIIAHTYDGWAESDIQEFKDMLVFPGWSGTTVPTAAINNDDYTFYWHIINGDPARHGNQGLFAMRTMMAMGIFLDNEVIYERALRYLQGLPHRADDLPYPSGPPRLGDAISTCEFFSERRNVGFDSTVPDYGYNEVISNYIFENGQSQESSRDQAHAIGGVSTIAVMAEMAWSQGDDLYGHLDNRPLLGLEFFYRYNLTATNSYPDQRTPWEPTIESGEYISRSDRSGRWTSRLINPGVNCDQNNVTRGVNNILQPVPEMNLAHYKDRLRLPSNEYTWLQRGHEFVTAELGVENEGTVTDHPGYGGLKFRRVSSGDPISGFDSNGLPRFQMNILPMTIEAENFDFFAINGNGRVYNDSTNGNAGNQYRQDQSVDIEQRGDGGFNVGSIDNGEWLTYTVYAPESGEYDIAINYAGFLPDASIQFEFDGADKTGEVNLPQTGGPQVYEDLVVARRVTLNQGVQQMRLLASGAQDAFNLNSISVVEGGAGVGGTGEGGTPPTNFAGANQACFYRDTDFSGTTSEANNFRTCSGIVQSSFNANHDNRISAISVGSGVHTIIYDDANFTGDSLCVPSSTNLNNLGALNDRASSFQTAAGNCPTTRPPENSTVHIRKRNAQDFALDGMQGAANAQNVYLSAQNPNDANQQWIEINRGGGFYSYQKQGTNQCIDGGNDGVDRQNVSLGICGDDDHNQHWQKVSTDNGFFKLIKRNAPGFAIDGGSGGFDGKNVGIYDSSNPSHNLQWSID